MSAKIGNVPGGVEIGSTPVIGGGGGGGGVSSVSGTAPITSSGGATPAIGITAATALARGTMSAADKAKLDGMTAGAAVASVSGTAPIVSSGGTTPAISITAATTTDPGSMSAADKTKLDGITAGAAVASVSGTAPIVSSGGTTPAISITAATGTAAGSMSAADKTKLDSLATIVKIADNVSFSSVTSVTISFSANAYRRIEFMFQGDSGGIDNIVLTGLSAGSYYTELIYAIGGGTPGAVTHVGTNNWLGGDGTTPSAPYSAKFNVDMPPAPARKGCKYDVCGGFTNLASLITRQGACFSSDTTHDPTAVVVTFPNSQSGTYTAYGYV